MKYLHNTAKPLRPIIQPWRNVSLCFLKASLTACKHHQINLSLSLHSILYVSCIHFSCNFATKRNNRHCICILLSLASESRAWLSLLQALRRSFATLKLLSRGFELVGLMTSLFYFFLLSVYHNHNFLIY